VIKKIAPLSERRSFFSKSQVMQNIKLLLQQNPLILNIRTDMQLFHSFFIFSYIVADKDQCLPPNVNL